jgi:hypothetical protein
MLEPRHLAAERVDFRRNAIEIATGWAFWRAFSLQRAAGSTVRSLCPATSATLPFLSCIVLPETEIYVMVFVNGDH